jgi:trehalose-6-phosphate synthase
MAPEEQTARMQRLRRVVKAQNIYRWAGNLIAELCEVRLDARDDMKSVSRASVA